MKRIVILLLLIAPSAFGQSIFGRASAGTIDVTPKQNRRFDGSFSLTSRRNFGATAGGTAVKDHLWFFASAQKESTSLKLLDTRPESTLTFRLQR